MLLLSVFHPCLTSPVDDDIYLFGGGLQACQTSTSSTCTNSCGVSMSDSEDDDCDTLSDTATASDDHRPAFSVSQDRYFDVCAVERNMHDSLGRLLCICCVKYMKPYKYNEVLSY